MHIGANAQIKEDTVHRERERERQRLKGRSTSFESNSKFDRLSLMPASIDDS